MPKTVSFEMTKIGKIKHFATHEDYVLFTQHKKALQAQLKYAPDALIRVVVTNHFWTNPTYSVVYLTTV